MTEEHPLSSTITLTNMASKLTMAKKFTAAVAVAERAVSLDKGRAITWHTLGSAHMNAGNFQEAIDCTAKAVDLEPEEPGHWHNLGLSQMWLGRFTQALDCLDKALELNPASPNIQWDRALLLLTAGWWKDGWKAYEFRRAYHPQSYPRHLMPYWTGQNLKGKRIFVQSEQGDGDVLMFSRYLRLLKEAGAETTVALPTQMLALFRNHPDIDHVCLTGENVPHLDYSVYMGSLPHLFGTTLDDVPPDQGYVKQRAKDIKIEIPEPAPGCKKVGIAWAGNERHLRDHQRSAPLELFVPLIARTDISLYSLQMGDRSKDIRENLVQPFIADLYPLMSDWTVTNSMVAQMDYVISVDTAIAHIAGLNDIPTLVMISKCPDFRWGWSSFSTPWYPSMTLFRQAPEAQDWKEVVSEVIAMLDNWLPIQLLDLKA